MSDYEKTQWLETITHAAIVVVIVFAVLRLIGITFDDRAIVHADTEARAALIVQHNSWTTQATQD